MDSATISARRTDHRHARSAAFSLSEVIIASALSSFVLAAVMSTFVFLGRTGFRTSALSELDSQMRRGLETFAEEVRLARDVHWNSPQSVTLYLPSGATTGVVTYAYDTDPGSATYRAFYRMAGEASSAASRAILIHELASDFSFRRYKLETASSADNTARTDAETKQLQIVLRAERSSGSAAVADQAMTSTRYILRNKRVSN